MTDTRLMEIVGQKRILPQGIDILGENIFLVPWELLELSDDSDFDWNAVCGEEEAQDLKGFVNPRRFGDESENGLDKPSMYELYVDIRDDGLHHHLICRWIIKEDGSIAVQVIDGERRYRNLNELRLKNELCWSQTKDKLLPATEVYAKVVCKCQNRSDDEALKIAIGCSERHVAWGEGATAKLIWQLQTKYKKSNEAILKLTGKSEQWLREQDQICRLRSSGDLKTFEYLCNEKINRSLALMLAKVKDVDERHAWLDRCYANAVAHRDEEVQRTQIALETAEQKEELAEGELAVAEQIGTPEDVEKAKKNLEEAQQKVAKKRKERAGATKPKAGTSDLREVTQNVQEETGGNSTLSLFLRPHQIQNCHLKPVQELIEKQGVAANGKVLFPPNELHILRYVEATIKAGLSGLEDIVGVLRRQKDALILEERKKTTKS